MGRSGRTRTALRCIGGQRGQLLKRRHPSHLHPPLDGRPGRSTRSSINPRLSHVDAVRQETRLGLPLQSEGEGWLKMFGTVLRSEFYVILTQGCDNPIVSL